MALADLFTKVAGGFLGAGGGGAVEPAAPSPLNQAGTIGPTSLNVGAKILGGRGNSNSADQSATASQVASTSQVPTAPVANVATSSDAGGGLSGVAAGAGGNWVALAALGVGVVTLVLMLIPRRK